MTTMLTETWSFTLSDRVQWMAILDEIRGEVPSYEDDKRWDFFFDWMSDILGQGCKPFHLDDSNTKESGS